MLCFHLIRPLIWPPASQGRRGALITPVCPRGWLGSGEGRVHTARHRGRPSREPRAQTGPAGKGERPRHLQTFYSVSTHSPLKCGRVHRDSEHSGSFSAAIHGLYIAAVPGEDYLETVGREFKSKSSAQVNAQGDWGSGLFSPVSPLPNDPFKGSFKGAEVAQCVCLSMWAAI